MPSRSRNKRHPAIYPDEPLRGMRMKAEDGTPLHLGDIVSCGGFHHGIQECQVRSRIIESGQLRHYFHILDPKAFQEPKKRADMAIKVKLLRKEKYEPPAV